jgi:hypothetical protein
MMSSSAIQEAGNKRQLAARDGVAWVALCVALAVHAADEGLTDFLSVYNPAVQSIRRQLPFLPLPAFTFDVWLTGLILAVILLLGLSVFAFKGARFMVPLSWIFGLFMLANSLLHIAGSIYMGRAMPGVYSSPLLLICATYLLITVHRSGRRH